MLGLLFFITLALFGGINRKLYGPTSETENSYLFLVGIGIMSNLATNPFKDTKLRIVAITLMFYALIMNNMLLGNVIEILNIPRVKEINSLSKLLEANFNIGTSRHIYNSLQHVTGDHMYQKLKAKLRIAPASHDTNDQSFLDGKFALLLSKEKAYILAETIYDDQGNDLIHVVPEQIHAFYVAFVARRGLPLVWKLNQLLLRMSQYGVIEREFARKFAVVDLMRLKRAKRGMLADTRTQTIGLHELEHMLTLEAVTFIICIFIFVLEIIYFKWSTLVRKNIRRLVQICEFQCHYGMTKAYEFVWRLIIYLKTI